MNKGRQYIARIRLAIMIGLLGVYYIINQVYGYDSFVWRSVPIACILLVPSLLINMYPNTIRLRKLGIDRRYLWWSNICAVFALFANIALLAALATLYDVNNLEGFGWQFGILMVVFLSYIMTSMLLELGILQPLRRKYKVAIRLPINGNTNNGNVSGVAQHGKPDATDIFE
jgi:hypothetical protein